MNITNYLLLSFLSLSLIACNTSEQTTEEGKETEQLSESSSEEETGGEEPDSEAAMEPDSETSESAEESAALDPKLIPAAAWDYNLDFSTGDQEARAINFGYSYYTNKAKFPQLSLIIVALEDQEPSVELMEQAIATMESNAEALKGYLHIPTVRTHVGDLLIYVYSDKTISKQDAQKLTKGIGTFKEMTSKNEKNWEGVSEYVK